MANVGLSVKKWVCLIECAPGKEKEIPIKKLERRIKRAKQKHPNAKLYIKVVSR